MAAKSVLWDNGFLATPDVVNGLQRRTGQYILDYKTALHERYSLEHIADPSITSPQLTHGLHRQGSSIAYVTDAGSADPTERPTGQGLLPVNLDANDDGRLFVKERSELNFWNKDLNGGLGGWALIGFPVGGIIPFTSVTAPINWLICDGSSLLTADYPALFAVIGYNYGGSGANFNIPNVQGAGIRGLGTQVVDTRTKGKSGGTIGEIWEDETESMTGTFELGGPSSSVPNLIYSTTGRFSRAKSSTFNQPIGIFGGSAKTEIVTFSGASRSGTETHGTDILLPFIIKAK